MLGFINRTIQFKNPLKYCFHFISLSIVRPHLEYCSAVWSPQYVKDKLLLERVQHRFSRTFPELKSLPYDQLELLWFFFLSTVDACNKVLYNNYLHDADASDRRSGTLLAELISVRDGLSDISFSGGSMFAYDDMCDLISHFALS